MAAVTAISLRRLAWGVALFLAPWSVGCVTLPHCGWGCKQPDTRVCNLALIWHNSVADAPNVLAGGKTVPTLAGRMYLLGPDGGFMTACGGFQVEVFDDNQPCGDKPLFSWTFKEDVMANLMKKDHWGVGYTVLLPWEGLANLCKVRLRTCYQPKVGSPVFTESVVTLMPNNGVIREGTGPITPAGFRR